MLYKGAIFKNQKFDFKKLEKFGFVPNSKYYLYKTNILDSAFTVTIKIFKDGRVDTNCQESSTGEQYNLIYVKDAEGKFVGKVREAFENVLNKIKDECTIFSAFKSEYANLVIKYVKQRYNDDAEYLWEKFPNTAIFRKKDNSKTGGKWYAALLTVSKNKIGIEGQGEIEIIDLKAKPEVVEKLIDNKKYFKGYHMNKKHWYTICLDGSVDIEEIKNKIDESYSTLT